MNIRFALSSDFQNIRQFDPHSNYIDPEKIKQKIAANEIILALRDQEIVGIIKFSYFWATRPYIDLVWVKQDFRRQGIGKQLIHYLEEYLVKEGYTHLLTSAEAQDPTAQSWHRSQGFVECGQITALNLPHDTTPEIFYYKRIASGDPKKDKLKTYVI
jgi:ribosomal protein S18 acetylase RimI-like enzyme